VATVDLLYTRAVHQIYVSDANLDSAVAVASGEDDRPLYGPLDATVPPRPAWHDTSFGEIYRISNRGEDRSVSLSTQLRKQFGATAALYASYAYSRVRDQMSLVNFPARANFSNTPLDGTQENRSMRPSFFETPHKVSVAATINLPHRTQLSLLYLGASQPPYTYVITGDANADGIGGGGSLPNDVVYVPRSATVGGDISLVTAIPGGSFVSAGAPTYDSLTAFIEQQPCLREQRGRRMERGSCRNGWLDVLNARLTKAIALTGGQRLEVTADVFNLPNLIWSRWGRHLDTTTDPTVPLLRLRGWDGEHRRGRYQLAPLYRGVVDEAASRWRMQLGARYVL
jgi:hypothetical protein